MRKTTIVKNHLSDTIIHVNCCTARNLHTMKRVTAKRNRLFYEQYDMFCEEFVSFQTFYEPTFFLEIALSECLA